MALSEGLDYRLNTVVKHIKVLEKGMLFTNFNYGKVGIKNCDNYIAVFTQNFGKFRQPTEVS